MLEFSDNAREAKKILRDGMVLVDGKPKREHNASIGLMDVVSIPKIKKQYRVLPSQMSLTLKEIPDAEANIKLRRIVGKKMLRGGKTQLLLHDGRTILPDKGTYRLGDTLVQEISSGKVAETLEFKEGNTALVVRGIHSGETGKITEVLPATSARKSLTKVGESQTLSDYIFVVGREAPVISL
jgi:small subunit ribosomal protein S4e